MPLLDSFITGNDWELGANGWQSQEKKNSFKIVIIILPLALFNFSYCLEIITDSLVFIHTDFTFYICSRIEFSKYVYDILNPSIYITILITIFTLQRTALEPLFYFCKMGV